MTVGELSDRLSLREFHDWQEFARLEPFPVERIDIAGALISSVLANINRGKGSKSFELDDFLVVKNAMKSEAQAAMSTEEREALHLQTFVLSMGGRIQ